MNQKLKENLSRFTRDTILYFAAKHPGENIVFSPYSIVSLLTIAANATEGKTRYEIVKALEGNSDYSALLNHTEILKGILSGEESLKTANAVMVKENFKNTIREGYEEEIKKIFDASLFSCQKATKKVNRWISEKTNGRIDHVADETDDDLIFGLLNAVAFDATWEKRYKPDKIKEEKFTNFDGSKSKISMMAGDEEEYLENKYYTGFMKPYVGSYSFVALLPKKEGQKFFSQALKHLDLSELYRNRRYAEIHTKIPEFQTEFGEDLCELCLEKGIHEIFTPKADFSPMSSQELMMSKIRHKAKIEVDKKGTRAAAVTFAVIGTGSIPLFSDFKEVILNRPFVYAIVHSNTGLPVFAGIVNRL